MQGVIFDLDGVLIDSSAIHDAAYRVVLGEAGIQEFDYRRVAGMRTKDAVKMLLGEAGIAVSDERWREISHRKTKLALERLQTENPLVDGCRETLTGLAARFHLALATSASRESAATFLDTNHFRPLFASILTGGDVERAKPHPEIYTRSCELLGFPPARCVVIEDAVAGVEAGKAAGARVIGLPGTTSAEALRHAGADAIVERLTDLLEVI